MILNTRVYLVPKHRGPPAPPGMPDHKLSALPVVQMISSFSRACLCEPIPLQPLAGPAGRPTASCRARRVRACVSVSMGGGRHMQSQASIARGASLPSMASRCIRWQRLKGRHAHKGSCRRRGSSLPNCCAGPIATSAPTMLLHALCTDNSMCPMGVLRNAHVHGCVQHEGTCPA